jgi:hypothetical protein
VAQHRNPVGRWRHALLSDLRVEQGVYEGALPGVELADDDKEEQLLEVRVRPPDELNVLGRRPEVLQEPYEPLEERSLALYQSLSTLVEDPHL